MPGLDYTVAKRFTDYTATRGAFDYTAWRKFDYTVPATPRAVDMAEATIPGSHWKTVSEVVTLNVAFLNRLKASGKVLSGTPTIIEVGTSDLTLANKTLNSGALVIDTVSQAANQAVTFSVTGGVAGTRYRIRITVADNGSAPAHTFVETLNMDVHPD